MNSHGESKRNKTKFYIILNAIALYLKFLLSSATRAGSPQKDVLPDTEKTGDLWLSSIEMYYSKKIRNFEFNNIKNDLHHEKEHKKLHITHLNSFSILWIVFKF